MSRTRTRARPGTRRREAGPDEARLKRVATLVPAPVRRLLLERPPEELRGWMQTSEAAVLFADVSGFTPLVEALAARGKEGLEQLREVMVRIFEPLVRVTESWGGDVLRFAGDAMTALFVRESGPLAALEAARHCAAQLQVTMGELQSRLPKGLPPLGLKVGLGSGPFRLAIVGEEAMALAIDGPALERAVSAEHHLERGEIGMHVPEGLDPRTLPEGHVHDGVWKQGPAEQRAWLEGAGAEVLAKQQREAAAAVEGERLPSLERLAPFVLEPLVQRILGGATDLLYEHRKLRVIFFNFAGLSLARPEDLPRLHRFFTEAQAVVSKHGGYVSELDMGDKGSNLVALFGAPVAIERPWIAAGQTALELGELSQAHGLTTKTGLSCGVVFCGEQGAPGWRLQYGVFGEAINRAARLMSKAPAGEVLVDPFFAEEADASFELERLPPTTLKGFKQPVVLSRLGPARRQRMLRDSDPLLGRDRERARLRERWQSALAGHGGTVVLSGPPGIGKSRLAEELMRGAWEDGALVLVGGGRLEAQGIPLEAVRAGLETLLGPLGGGPAGLAESHSPTTEQPSLMSVLVERSPVGPADPKGGSSLLLQSALAVVDRLVEEHSRERPLLWVLEDLQWMDPASLELVRDQGLGAVRRRVLLVLTGRSVLPLNIRHLEHVELAALQPDETVALALQHLGAQLLDRGLEQLVLGLGHGNPLMLRELCRHLVSNGLVSVTAYGQAHLTRAVGEDLPGSLEAMMLARFDRLPVETRHLLQIACCLGTEFSLTLLSEVAALDGVETPRLLGPAGDAGMVLESTSGHLSFAQPLLREVVHGSLSRADRRRLHGAAGTVLEARMNSGGTVEAARLAYHFGLAGSRRPAFCYSVAAAREAQREGAMPEALQHLDRAVELLASSSLASERGGLAELLERRAEIHGILGNQSEAIADARRLSRLAGRRKDPYRQARGWLLESRARTSGSHYSEAAAAAQKAFGAARDGGWGDLAAEADLQLGQIDIFRGLFSQAERSLQEGLALTSDAGEVGLRAKIHRELGRLYARTSEVERSRHHYRAALQGFERQRDFNGQLRCFEGLAFLSLPRDPDEGSEWASKALALSRQIGSRSGEAAALLWLGWAWSAKGQLDLAETQIRQAIAAYDRAGDIGGMASCTNNLAVLLHQHRRLDAAEPLYREALEMFERSGNLPVVCVTVNNLAELYEDRGEPARAAATYSRGLELARQMRNAVEETKALFALARWALLQGQISLARQQATDARDVALRAGLHPVQAQMEQFLGSLAAQSQDSG